VLLNFVHEASKSRVVFGSGAFLRLADGIAMFGQGELADTR
jgi:hypothetical protein